MVEKGIENEIQVGSSIGMAFNHGSIDHPIYGQATCSGAVPLLLPHGDYKQPAIATNPELLNNMVGRLLPKYRDVWPEDIDEDIERRLRDYITMGGYMNPHSDITDPREELCIAFMIIEFVVDDVIDNLSDMETLQFGDVRKHRTLIQDVFRGKYERVEDIQTLIPALIPLNSALFKFSKMWKAHIQDPELLEIFIEELSIGLSGNILIMEPGNRFSAGSNAFFRSYSSGGSVTLEFIAATRGIIIPAELRQNILFQRMKVCIGNVTDSMNTVLGLERDIRKGQVKDSAILTAVVQGGMSLQDAFNKTYQELCSDMEDIRLAVRKLRELYSGDKGAEDYLACAERYVDGQTYCYARVERYGSLGLKLVNI